MQRNRHRCRNFWKYLPAIIIAVTLQSACAVYTVDLHHLEARIKPLDDCCTAGLNRLLHTASRQYNNHIDSLRCILEDGQTQMKKLRGDSRLRITTKSQKVLYFYTRTVFIWKEEFLIGERSTLSWRNSLYTPVRLRDILRIEVKN
jgi:hypothetical protein